MIWELKCARNALKSTTRRKTSIGAVGPMLMTMEERSGGAAEREARNNLVASSPSIFPKMMRMRKKKQGKTNKKIRT